MSITVFWDETDSHVIRWEFVGHWTWEEYFTAYQRSNEMCFSRSPARVDMIADISRAPALPQNALSNIGRASLKGPDNWGISVVVGANPFINAMIHAGKLAYRTAATKYFTAKTVHEALVIIHQQRELALDRELSAT